MKLFKESDSNKKIVVTDFGRIKPAELVPHYNMTRREIRESMLLVTPNGRLIPIVTAVIQWSILMAGKCSEPYKTNRGTTHEELEAQHFLKEFKYDE